MPEGGRFADEAAMRAWLASPRRETFATRLAPDLVGPGLEHHHVAQRRAAARRGEGLVDPLEREALGDRVRRA